MRMNGSPPAAGLCGQLSSGGPSEVRVGAPYQKGASASGRGWGDGRQSAQGPPDPAFSFPRSSMSIRWPGCSLGSHAWILIAMFQLAMDLPSCESLGPGPDFRLLPRPPQRPPRLWSLKSGQAARLSVPVWSPRPARVERSHGQVPSPRARRAHRPRDQVAALVPRGGLAKPPAAAKSSPSLGSSSSSPSPAAGSGATTDPQALLRREKRHLQGAGLGGFDFRGSRPTTETEFIAWGPTGEEEAPESNTFPGLHGPTTASISQTRKTTVATATTTATATTATSTPQTKGVTEPLGPRNRIPVGVSTTEPSTSPSKDDGEDAKPPRILGETSGTPTSFLFGVRFGGGHSGVGLVKGATLCLATVLGGTPCVSAAEATATAKSRQSGGSLGAEAARVSVGFGSWQTWVVL